MHTQGKLHFDSNDAIRYTEEDGNDMMLEMAGVANWWTKTGIANSRRLVALWNACEGISTEDIEAGCVAKLVEAAKAMFDTPMDGLQRFRDLRDALAPFLQTEKPAGEGGPGG